MEFSKIETTHKRPFYPNNLLVVPELQVGESMIISVPFARVCDDNHPCNQIYFTPKEDACFGSVSLLTSTEMCYSGSSVLCLPSNEGEHGSFAKANSSDMNDYLVNYPNSYLP